MKGLFITGYFPKNPDKDVHGVFKRMNVLLEALGRVADDIDFLAFYEPPLDVHATALKMYVDHFSHVTHRPVHLFLVPQRPVPEAAGLIRLVHHRTKAFIDPFSTPINGFCHLAGPAAEQAVRNCLARRPDLIFVHRLPAMGRILKARSPLPPVFFDLDDIEHWSCLRGIPVSPTWRLKFRYALNVIPLLAAERAAMKAAKCTYVCSETDRDYLRKLSSSDIHVIPNSIDIPPAIAETPGPASLLFLGYYGYKPNVLAAEYLVREIWPRVKQRVPEAALTIAGAGAEVLGCSNARVPGVQVTGFVQDLAALYATARVVCCPMLTGGGTRIKIIEAAAYAKPVVATRVGAEGLAFQNETEILIRNDPDAFAETCIALLTNHALCSQIGRAARQKAIEYYDRSRVIDRIALSLFEGLHPGNGRLSRH
ncbi:MAG: glycosyltransferase [Acetobacteraceae bacterium]|nr:glycosyltransferase [Acetobacteraceae bacterium]